MPSLRLLVVDTDAGSDAGSDVDSDVAATIAAHRGDGAVAAVVHGAPSLFRWRSACAAIAREAGLVVVTGGRTSGGTLLLSSLGVDADSVRSVPFAGGYLAPGAAIGRLRLLGSPFVLAGARLSGPADTDRLRSELGDDQTPSIVSIRGSELDVGDGITITDAGDVPGGLRLDLELGS